MPFKGQKSLGPLESLYFVPGPFTVEYLNWFHLVIWQGRFYNTTPHLQHRYINNYENPHIVEGTVNMHGAKDSSLLLL
jgi:hypothetical protein